MTLSLQSRRLFALAIPMIISNITTPIIGLVDTAVMGHMQDVSHLAGVSLGAIILTQMIWICGFLRMSATGLSAQSHGKQDPVAAGRVLLQTISLGLALGALLVICQTPLLQAGLWLAEPSPEVTLAATEYFQIRVWSAPVAMMNLALIGWLVGQQKHRHIMQIQILANVVNAGLDIVLVFGFDLGVSGVAIASVCAELLIFVLAAKVAWQTAQGGLGRVALLCKDLSHVLLLNSDMLVRNLALQLCLAFVTYTGISFGDVTASVNAIILQFFTLIALGLDGLAYAVEALVGQAAGQDKQQEECPSRADRQHSSNLKSIVNNALWWSNAFAMGYSLVFAFAGSGIVALLTDIDTLRIAMSDYLIFLVALPIVAHWCFLFDGVYIGLTKARLMRNSMLLCTVLFFFPGWMALSQFDNQGLWSCFLLFLALRGITLGYHFYRYEVSVLN